MHGAYLHTTAHSMQQGSRQAEFRTRDTETGFVFEKTGQKDLNFDWSEWYDCNFQAVCLEIPYPATGGPGGNFGIVAHMTPIDAETTACFFWRHRKVSGWQADVWQFSTGPGWRNGTGTSWSRTGWSWKPWRPTPTRANISTATTSASRGCAA